MTPSLLTFKNHSLLEALLKSAVLAAVALLLRHRALGGAADAAVDPFVLHRPLEEALATGRENVANEMHIRRRRRNTARLTVGASFWNAVDLEKRLLHSSTC